MAQDVAEPACGFLGMNTKGCAFRTKANTIVVRGSIEGEDVESSRMVQLRYNI